MKRIQVTAIALACSIAAGCAAGAEPAEAARKTPKLAKKQVSVKVNKSIKVSAKHVTAGMKVTVKQSAASKKKVKAQWKAKNKKLLLTGKKAGKGKVSVLFRKKKKTYTSVLNVTVKAENRTPEHTVKPPEGTLTPTPTSTPGTTFNPETMSLKDIYKDSFLVGAAINGSSTDTMALHHEGMTNILKKHFNSTTLSNLMKPEHLLDEKATRASADGMPVCKFDTCDEALQFCKENGIRMRGHTLVWHNQTPEWFFCEDYDKDKKLVDAATMEKRMDSYMRQVITHCQTQYPGVVYCWDVVNECVCTDTNSYIVTSGGWKLRASTLQDNDFTHESAKKNFWYATMGETYVEKAFATARKYADPDVKLFYNDYNVFQTLKMKEICKMAEELKGKGLIDGIGLQPTVLYSWPALDSERAGSFRVCLETYAKLGLELQVTELSFQITGEVTDKKLQKQSDRYEEFMRLLLKEDSEQGGPCNITSVTVFGICDDYPLYTDFSQNLYLWDKFCNPKPCLYGFALPGLQLRKEG